MAAMDYRNAKKKNNSITDEMKKQNEAMNEKGQSRGQAQHRGTTKLGMAVNGHTKRIRTRRRWGEGRKTNLPSCCEGMKLKRAHSLYTPFSKKIREGR